MNTSNMMRGQSLFLAVVLSLAACSLNAGQVSTPEPAVSTTGTGPTWAAGSEVVATCGAFETAPAVSRCFSLAEQLDGFGCPIDVFRTFAANSSESQSTLEEEFYVAMRDAECAEADPAAQAYLERNASRFKAQEYVEEHGGWEAFYLAILDETDCGTLSDRRDNAEAFLGSHSEDHPYTAANLALLDLIAERTSELGCG